MESGYVFEGLCTSKTSSNTESEQTTSLFGLQEESNLRILPKIPIHEFAHSPISHHEGIVFFCQASVDPGNLLSSFGFELACAPHASSIPTISTSINTGTNINIRTDIGTGGSTNTMQRNQH